MLKFIKNKLREREGAKYYTENLLPILDKDYKPSTPQKDKPENILYINTYLGAGGAAKIVYDMIANPAKTKGYSTKHLVGKPYHDAINGLIDKDIFTLEPNPSNLKKLEKATGWLDFFQETSLNIKNLEIFKEADIIHLNNLHGDYFSPFALPEITALKPTIWTLHDMQAATGKCPFPLDCEKWMTGCEKCPQVSDYPEITKDTTEFLYSEKAKIYAKSDFTVVCYSKWMKRNLKKSILKDKDIRFIYNGIDENIFKPYNKDAAREELNLPLDKKILLFSANMGLENHQKGGQYIKEAMKHFETKRDDVLFIILGASETRSVSNHQLNIKYVQDESTVAKYYSAADLFVFPTMAESFGLVIAEALGCETPVISFDVGPIPEMVEHMKNGYIASYKDSGDFTKGIETFLDDETLMKSASKEARNTVLKSFTRDKMVNEYINLYQEVYESRKNRV